MARRSNETALVAVMILGFLAVSIWLVVRNNSSEEVEPPMSTYSARPEGTRALFELAGALGYEPQRFHETEYDYPAQSTVVILDSPDFQLSLMMGGALNATALRLWIEDGGRLLLFSAPMKGTGPDLFNDADQAEGVSDEDFNLWDLSQTGPGGTRHRVSDPRAVGTRLPIAGGSGQQSALWSLYNPGVVYELTDPKPLLWQDVGSFEVADAYVPFVNGHTLLAASTAGEPVVVHRKIGEGEVIWVPRPEIAANSWIERRDNHRLVLALLDYMAAGRPLYFDEHLHGFRRQRETLLGMLFGTRGGALILVLCMVSVVYFLGRGIPPARYRPRSIPQRRQATEMVLAQADLYRRAGAWHSIAESLVGGVKRNLMLALHEPRPMSDAGLADWLDERHPGRRDAFPALSRYLASEGGFRAADVLELARDCDRVTALLEQGGFAD